MPFNKNMDMRSAVYRAFASETFPKMMMFMFFLGGGAARSVGLWFLFMGLLEKKSVSDTFVRLTQSQTKSL